MTSWKELQKPLKELEQIHWNCCKDNLEPVGVMVRVLTKGCEVLIASRKVPNSGYNGNGYYKKGCNTIVDNVLYWSYM